MQSNVTIYEFLAQRINKTSLKFIDLEWLGISEFFKHHWNNWHYCYTYGAMYCLYFMICLIFSFSKEISTFLKIMLWFLSLYS
jgi:hypothetical protein